VDGKVQIEVGIENWSEKAENYSHWYRVRKVVLGGTRPVLQECLESSAGMRGAQLLAPA